WFVANGSRQRAPSMHLRNCHDESEFCFPTVGVAVWRICSSKHRRPLRDFNGGVPDLNAEGALFDVKQFLCALRMALGFEYFAGREVPSPELDHVGTACAD